MINWREELERQRLAQEDDDRREREKGYIDENGDPVDDPPDTGERGIGGLDWLTSLQQARRMRMWDGATKYDAPLYARVGNEDALGAVNLMISHTLADTDQFPTMQDRLNELGSVDNIDLAYLTNQGRENLAFGIGNKFQEAINRSRGASTKLFGRELRINLEPWTSREYALDELRRAGLRAEDMTGYGHWFRSRGPWS